ncbi:EAL domain-containing protein [Cupriavidus basilensis]|uniref:cyclic-guanylate-specific phosphodiesterase n=1 Tax=Cupriavidus basilensis TaxID=68895 RepID=A0ABT6AQ62_9BURK|nr:EAL domain-containing protein [Cupriavidus basilensis]MDF3834769.1 EAL domain-containing protein [Cupriavidus basilensis]
MPTRIMRGRLTGLRLLSITMAAALPFLLMLQVIYIEAQRQAEEEAIAASEIVLRQTETMLNQAVNLTGVLATLAAQPCDQVAAQLQQIGAFRPYFRSLFLVRDDTLYCSSATGALQLPIPHLTKRPGPLPMGRSLYILPGTPKVPDRPALLVALRLDGGRGAIATLDGQYLQDLLAAASPRDRFAMAIVLKHSGSVLAGPGGSPLTTPGLDTLPPLPSERYSLSVHAGIQPSVIAALRNQLLAHYAPFMLLASLLLAYAAYRFHMQRLSMVAEIRRGMRNNEFHVHYQPLLELASGRTSGVEALIRWNKPGAGPIRPDLLFSVAEDNGLALPLTRHLFALIQRDVESLSFPPGFHIGVNITAEHLASTDMIADVQRLQQALHGKAPRLVLEITERKVVPDTDAVLKNIQALRAAGVQFAIDDFGTGHSSLAYLERFTVDYIKIDRGFVSVINTDAVNAPVLELIIALGARLDVTLIAEGIETETQAAYLRGKGVKYAQGFLFARPMSARALQSWIDSQSLQDPGSELGSGIAG